MQNNGMPELTPEEVEEMLDQTFQRGEDAIAELENKPDNLTGLWQIRGPQHAYAEREPWRYLTEGLIPYPSLIAVYGGPGSLKSMLMADLCAAIVKGDSWLPPLQGDLSSPGVTFEVEQQAIFWIDFDNGTRRTDERMDAVLSARDVPVDAPFHYVSMPRPWLDLGKVGMVESLARTIKQLKAKFIVIDNLGLITGDTEENSGEMAQLMGQLRWLCEDTESSICVIHHQRKSSGGGDKGINKSETLRGHSSINAALDLALLVERTNGTDDITCLLTKVRGFAQYLMFGGKFTYEHVENTHDLDTAKFFSRAVNDAEELENMAIESEILRQIEETPGMKQKELVDKVRSSMEVNSNIKTPSVNRVRGLIDNLIKSEDIRTEAGSNNSMLHFLPFKM